ncbi:inverse autotransporter beta-barrel domain-containing protein [Hyphomicrobium nitrativorans]|nr:inverse autotransporter beta-barrel domain-containing protein [Hyphomicrobium nitrativorans]
MFLLGSASPVAAQEKWAPWLELGGFYGSSDTSRGEAVLWVPLAQGATSLLFGEMRGKLFEDDMREGNFALGYRQMSSGGWNLGFWGGYDIRESQFGNTFRQLTGGIEALSDRWDFRANAYLPLNDSENLFRASSFVTTAPVLEFTGSTIGLVTNTTTTTISQDELALWGIDAEIGAKLYATPLDLPGPRHELRVYAGAYHFDHPDLPDSLTGPRLRAEWRVDEILGEWDGSRLTFEGEYSHDDLRDDRFEIGARLRLPFGAEGRSAYASRALTAQERRMSEGLERDTDIVTDTRTTSTTTDSTATEAVEDAETGVRFDRVATVDATGDLTTTSSTAGANSLIIANGDAGALVGEHTIEGAQTLMGAGSTIEVRGTTSGTVMAFTAEGSRPTFQPSAGAGGDQVVLNTASDTHVTGINIAGATSSAYPMIYGIVLADGSDNVLIDDVDIRTLTASGIFIGEDSSDVTVRNSSFFDLGRIVGNTYGGILIRDRARDITLTNLEMSGVFTGIFFGRNSEATLSDSTIHGANGSGLALVIRGDATVSFTGLTVSGAFDQTISFFGGNILVIDAGTGGTTVAGTGNTIAPGTTHTNAFCDSGSWNGSFEFDGTTYTDADC